MLPTLSTFTKDFCQWPECQAPIIWATAELNDNFVAVDYWPSDGGTVLLVHRTKGRVPIAKTHFEAGDGQKLRTEHADHE